ncbi:MAG: FIST C-terminal domain-containing protein [Betaproteobacteria bacterium]|nr:FIST C-terminal domain-containing protein [Betaproteobacteria bacterium]
MQTTQLRWVPERRAWNGGHAGRDADLVLAFANADHFHSADCYHELRDLFPNALIAGCSSAGSILDTGISDGDVVATAVRFEKGRVRLASVQDVGSSKTGLRALARHLTDTLQAPDLRHVLIFSDGLEVNGSELAAGLSACGVPVTGGLAADGTRFARTWVMADAPARSGTLAAIGLYGDLKVASGCFAGWQEFGAERRVTRAEGNVVHAIDGQPALALYKRYLGDQAEALPGSGLRFPLSIRATREDPPVIRTLLAVDEPAQTLTFAGDVPQGSYCRLMKSGLDDLIESAGHAAAAARPHPGQPGLCLVVSCVGRRLVLGQFTEEELDPVRNTLGPATAITGFYSYGELAPFSDFRHCRLHNQTMTLTTVHE